MSRLVEAFERKAAGERAVTDDRDRPVVSWRKSRATAMPSAAEIEVDACPR
jgi:hypothetical protein